MLLRSSCEHCTKAMTTEGCRERGPHVVTAEIKKSDAVTNLKLSLLQVKTLAPPFCAQLSDAELIDTAQPVVPRHHHVTAKFANDDF